MTFFDRSVESVDTFVHGAGLALFLPLLAVVIVDAVHQTRTDRLTVAYNFIERQKSLHGSKGQKVKDFSQQELLSVEENFILSVLKLTELMLQMKSSEQYVYSLKGHELKKCNNNIYKSDIKKKFRGLYIQYQYNYKVLNINILIDFVSRLPSLLFFSQNSS